jgi:hypothetical protein
MSAQHCQLMPHLRNLGIDEIAGVRQTGNRTQGQLFAAACYQYRRARPLHWLWFEDRILDVEITAMKGRPWLGPHLHDQLDRFLHLPNVSRFTSAS